MPPDPSYTTPQLRALTEAGVILTSELSLSAVLQKVVDVARELVGARYGALSVLDKDGRIEEFLTSGITQEERARIGALPRGRGLLGVILHEGTTLRMEKLRDDPRSAGFPPNHPEMQSLLGVPVVWADRVIGNLYLTEREGGPFTENDEEIVRLLSTQAAVAIRNAELLAQLESFARLEERERIAMDLHDGVIQSIYAVGLQLEDISERMEETPTSARDQIDRAINSLNDVIKDIRSYIFDLRPSASKIDDLPAAIRGLAEDLRVNTLIETDVELDGAIDGSLNDSQAIGLYHIAQEALNNIGKHSNATSARVALSSDGRTVRLEVRDNGIGLPKEDTQQGGQGIRNMKDRAKALGASIAFESEAKKGTTIRVVMPLNKQTETELGR